MNFDLNVSERKEIWNFLLEELENYYAHTHERQVAPELNTQGIRKHAQKYSFEQVVPSIQALQHVLEGLEQYAVHTPHPSYFGLFNPRANFPSILADLISATYNPQMAAWSHSPFAAEVETYLLQEFGRRFGFPQDSIDGVFTSGGAEANLTALISALNQQFPDYAQTGLRGLAGQPLLYCTTETHHSIVKAARTTGLGMAAVRSIPVNQQQQMRMDKLEEQLIKDTAEGHQPFLLVVTAGATGTGAIDDLPRAANLARKYNLWLHVDAAYGGAAVLEPGLAPLLSGIEAADSITFDAHKWLSVPMAAGMFLTRHRHILDRSFRTLADYMPKEAGQLEIVDPFTHSLQWSRRFIGLKVYLSLLFFGWEGYSQVIRHQTEMGNLLKKQLKNSGWKLYNYTDFPIACFTDPAYEKNADFAAEINRQVVQSGKAWISIYQTGEVQALRACITNYATTEKEVTDLVELLNQCRKNWQK
ncbi:pyridoxal phosphate-dependent decarboxylase family protein [Nafulsella turpanensis]|uniref:pyridoxal phosphate-dependent decarboxylase family protein n=1 Tax=Nafulsella turpanensis TaxID=1265690 RepID=UPI00034935CF|nr:aminotransferase class V-fold PLP-dependent enzyme [Nafulsella turpanensis]